ncbi:hypothetical protein [Blastochloris tepida]|uniref:hypothetical protein n=1 Tax=Blastochloris tepida TaxID=2233851 RepID=UPI000F829D13|nr:hypothetical protein [Blastochloris tepida]
MSRFLMSPKSAEPLRVRHRLVHDALILAALDPDVRAIEAAPVEIAGTPAPVDVIVLGRTDGRFVLDVPEAHPRDLDAAGLALLAIESLNLPTLSFPAPDIRRQPRWSNAVLVWDARAVRVPVDARVQVLAALAEAGTLTLHEAAQATGLVRGPVSAVLALACADLLAIDLDDGPLGPETRVRRIPSREDAR